jgi:uncharacterized protein YigA (DUF484 family)
MASKTNQISDTLSETQVIEFLEAHPDFLERNPTLLTKLKFSHQVGDGAVSLIERQVQALREEQQQFAQRFEQLAANAQLNQQLLDKIEKFTIELLDCANAQPMLHRTHHLLDSLFGLQLSQILFEEKMRPELTKGIQRLKSDEMTQIVELVKDKPAYLGRSPEWISNIIGSADASGLKSIALMPLAVEKGHAFILLGSQDEQRFRTDMGSNFLTYIGALIGRLLDRLE